MSDLFVSYASEDREQVAKLVQAFEAQGWTVWWDRKIETGTSFDRQIEEELDSSRCVVVVWSKASLNSDWVRAEAAEGLERNILVPVLLDDVRPPLLFRQKQAISLVDWKRSSNEAQALIDLMPSIAAILASYTNSALPISTQRSWALGRVRNETDNEMLSGAAYQVLSLGMSYFENAFLYTAERDGSQADRLSISQLEELVEEEGLDGYIVGELAARDESLLVELRIVEPGRMPVVRALSVDDPDEIVTAIVELLIDSADLLQGRSLHQADRLRAYMANLNLEALHLFSRSFEIAAHYDYPATKTILERALELCGDFIPAYRGLAIACLYLGQFSEARNIMARAMQGMENESDRNRYFARGMYYSVFSEDHEKAAAEYEAIVRISPLDASAINNLAVCRFYQLRFREAMELAERDLQLYPSKTLGLQNAAYYAMYAGDFSRADELASQVLEHESSFVRANVVRALVRAEQGRLEEAKNVYRSAICGQPRLDSILLQGLADIAMAEGNLDEAAIYLDEGMTMDVSEANAELQATKMLMRLECELMGDQTALETASERVEAVLQLSDSVAVLAKTALMGLQYEDKLAKLVHGPMKKKVNAYGRAYARMIEAVLAISAGDLGEAMAKLSEARQVLDLWLIRFCAYLVTREAGLILEANDERAICLARAGEGLSAALDELPTFRFLASLKADQ